MRRSRKGPTLISELTRFSDVPSTHWAYYQSVEATNAHTYDKVQGGEEWIRVIK